jgi:hypothetical protein
MNTFNYKDYSGENRIEKIEGKEKIKKNVFKIDSEDEYKNLGNIDTTHMFLQQFSSSGKTTGFSLSLERLSVVGEEKLREAL